MKRLFTILIIAALLICGPLQLTTLATVSYDSGESVTKNMVDALIAIANGTLPMLNDVLIVDGDRTDDYTADGSFAAPYKTIQAADTASVSGDVILVTPGTYTETVTLNTGVHLFGWNVAGATLTGEYVLFNGTTITIDGAAVVLNEGSDDVDFRVESNGGTAALFVDAGNDRVGIHTAAPTVPFEVTGNSKITGTLEATSTATLGALAVDTDVLSVDATNDIVEINGWADLPYTEITSTPYTIAAASKANVYVVNYTDTGAVSVVLGSDVFVDGRWITIKDGELNANNNNIVISTEGSETIDEAASYTMNAAGEAVTLFSDGTNMFVIGGFSE